MTAGRPKPRGWLGAVALAAVLAAASPAFADVEVNPNPVSPGSAVWVNDGYRQLFCPSTDRWAVATSKGFKGDSIKLTRQDSHHALVGMGWAVDRPGTYGVSIKCASGKSSGPHAETLVVSARGAARTGDGASLISSGSGEAAGLALLGGAVAIGAVAVRRKVKADR